MTEPQIKPFSPARAAIELVAIDIDGTLLNSSIQLTDRVEKAIKAATAQGVKIVLATGKTRVAALDILTRLGLQTPGIYVQGVVTYSADGSIQNQLILKDSVVRQVLTFAEDRGFTALAYSGSRILMRAHNADIEAAIRKYHDSTPEIVGPIQNLLASVSINKVVLIGDARAITALRWQLNIQIGTSARLVQAGIPSMLEVLPPGASKGTALKRLASELKITTDRIMAIGDAENDVEMIQFAGIGIAMGNADDKTKAAANHVVATNDADGVAEALERFVIIPPPPAPPVDVVAPTAVATTAETTAPSTPADATTTAPAPTAPAPTAPTPTATAPSADITTPAPPTSKEESA